MRFTTVKPLIRSFSRKACLFDFPLCFFPKTSRKPLRNDVRTLQKSMLKTYCFVTSIFGGFGLDFGASWAPKMGSGWPKIPILTTRNPPLSDLKLITSKKWRLGELQVRFVWPRASILEAPGLILKPPGLDFGGSGVDFVEVFACFWYIDCLQTLLLLIFALPSSRPSSRVGDNTFQPIGGPPPGDLQ